MSDGLDKHIGTLTRGVEGPEEKPADGTLDGGDTLVEEISSIEDRAVPDSVIDEQAEQFAKTSESTQDDSGDKGDDSKPLDYKALYEAEQRSASGRLGELRTVRMELGKTQGSIEELRKVFLEREQREADRIADEERAFELDEERRLYGNEVVDDPAVSYMRDKMVQTQEMLSQQADQQQRYRDSITQQAAQNRHMQDTWVRTREAVRAQEEKFVEDVPDYGDAYQYARDKRKEMYVNRGYDPRQAEVFVDQEEEGIRQEQLGRPGGSVPGAVYEIAKMFGWSPDMSKTGNEASKPARQSISHVDTAPNFNKMRAGIGARGAGEMHGTTGSHDNSRSLSAEEFFNTVPLPQRLEILADPDKFEELGKTGKIVMY